jgi:hypothetical protein
VLPDPTHARQLPAAVPDAPAPHTPRSTGMDACASLVARFAPRGHRITELLRLLTERRWEFAEIVALTGISRRTVEEVLTALGDDAEQTSDGFRVHPRLAAAYQSAFPAPAPRPPVSVELRAEIERVLAGAPAPRRALDHVAATPATLLRRASWLADEFPTANRLLCVGDHDLTSLAACLLRPELEALVVDIDEDLLRYLDEQATRLGLHLRTCYADLRFALPDELHGWADVAFTDPPYTPDGVALFARHAVAGLRTREFGVAAIAYGHGEQLPALGFAVQEALAGLGLVFEAILPHFHAYAGAQAIGGRADMYVCRPTSRTWKQLDRRPRSAGRNLYTHGPHSVESHADTLAAATRDATLSAATSGGALPLTALVGDGWPPGTERPSAPDRPSGPERAPRSAQPARVTLAALLTAGLPSAVARYDGAVAVNLTDDPGPWLLRALLAANAPRLALLLPNNHPDLGSADRQQALRTLLDAKYALELRRSTPTSRHALVVATRVDVSTLSRADRLRRHLLDHAGGTVRSSWRDGLVAAFRQHPRGDDAVAPFSKDEARALVESHAGALRRWPARLLDLPRHQLSALLSLATATLPADTPAATDRSATASGGGR